MSTLLLTRIKIALLAFAWWCCFVLLFITGFDHFWLLPIVGFSFLLLIPGYFIVSSITLPRLGFWSSSGFVVGFSVLLLFGVGLIANSIGVVFDIPDPLNPQWLFIGASVSTLILGVVWWRGARNHVLKIGRYVFFEHARDAFFAFVPVLFIPLSIVGAIQLNNGGEGDVNFLLLLGIGLYVVVLLFGLRGGRDLHGAVIPTALYSIGLSLLLMTSLRGWFVTGHDVQTEYYVFELTKQTGMWVMDLYRNAYNACVSITIFPTLLAFLLRVADPFVYKVLFQILFAFVPPLVYLIIRRYVSTAIAFLATFYFISFPTFFGDMPMLNRQEIAFLFWALMILCIVESRIDLVTRRILFVLFGTGVILSHYSTTYTVIALLIFLVLMRRPLLALFRYGERKQLLGRSGLLDGQNGARSDHRSTVNMTVVLILCTLTFMWSSVLTDTSSGSITRVVLRTFEAMRSATQDDARSMDVFYGLFSWGKMDTEAALLEYTEKVVRPLRSSAPALTYYDTALYHEYTMHTAAELTGPLSSIGTMVAPTVPVQNVHFFLRQLFAKLLQLLLLIGCISIMFRRSFQLRTFGVEFSLLILGSLCFVVLQVLLPVLSSEYGVFRAFQQSLIFLGVCVVIGSMTIMLPLKNIHRGYIVSAVFALAFYFSMTGVVSHIFLQYPPQLHASNFGSYYGLYYTRAGDIGAAEWIDTNIPKENGAQIQTDRTGSAYLMSISGVELLHGITPGLIRRDAYVLLNNMNIRDQRSYVLWNGDAIMYTYPLPFIEEQKDLLYDNGHNRIYK